MRNCNKCGAQIDEDSEFCSSCGEPLIKSQSAQKAAIDRETQQRPTHAVSISHKNRNIIFAVALIAVIAVAALFVAGMFSGGTSSFVTPFSPPFDFAVNLSPGGGTVLQGNSLQASVSILLLSGSSQQVTLSASGPNGVYFNFNPQTIAADSTGSTLTINVPESVATKTYSVTVTASGRGKTHSATYTMYVLSAKIFVSGTVTTTGLGTHPTNIKFVNVNTGQTYETAVNGNSYGVYLPNQQGYHATCSWAGLLWSSGTFDGGSLIIDAGVGQVSLTKNFKG